MSTQDNQPPSHGPQDRLQVMTEENVRTFISWHSTGHLFYS